MPDYLEQLRARLLKLGCPIARIRRLVREVADHREDLKQAGLADGLSEADAEARADSSLGHPLVLAEQMMTAVRRSSWWGRHYVVTFGFLPILAYVLWFLMPVCEMWLIMGLGYGWNHEKFAVATSNPITFHHFLLAFRHADYLGIALAALLFCWLAQRTAVQLKWTVISCVIWSLLALVSWVELMPNMSLNLRGMLSTDLGTMSWRRAMIPLLIVAAAYAVQRWRAWRFEREVAVE